MGAIRRVCHDVGVARSDKGGRHRVSPFCRRGHDRRITGMWGDRCAQCGREKATAKRAERKELVAAYKLGKGCSQCGYSQHPAALHLHHLDPAEKNWTVSKMSETMSDEKWWQEVRKCAVLCANCHNILHYDGR